MNSVGLFPNVRGFIAKMDGTYLIFTSDDSGVAISTMNSLGELTKQWKLPGYPSALLIKAIENENFQCIMKPGIVTFNHDGYLNQ